MRSTPYPPPCSTSQEQQRRPLPPIFLQLLLASKVSSQNLPHPPLQWLPHPTFRQRLLGFEAPHPNQTLSIQVCARSALASFSGFRLPQPAAGNLQLRPLARTLPFLHPYHNRHHHHQHHHQHHHHHHNNPLPCRFRLPSLLKDQASKSALPSATLPSHLPSLPPAVPPSPSHPIPLLPSTPTHPPHQSLAHLSPSISTPVSPNPLPTRTSTRPDRSPCRDRLR
jgi:hypothetical protein